MKVTAKILVILMAIICVWGCNRDSGTQADYVKEFLHDRVVMEDDTEKMFGLQEGDQLFYLIRHAEKDTNTQIDPALSEKGMSRANRLVGLFRKTRVDAIYSTLYMRTLLTVDSLANSKGLGIKAYNPDALEAFSDSLQAWSNLRSVLVVGHSNTTPVLANLLSGQNDEISIREEEYDHLFVVVNRKASPDELWKLKFRNE